MARISQEKKDEIRNSILEVSGKLFFDLGYEETSTKVIAKEVGIAEGTIFNYFDSKSEIFFEAFAADYEKTSAYSYSIDTNLHPSDILYTYVMEVSNKIFRLPKKIILELFLASMKIANKNPKLFQRLAAIDFKYLAELQVLTQRLIDSNIIADCDSKKISEIIYSIFIFEMMLYIYDKDMLKEDMFKQIKDKLRIVIKNIEEE